MAVFVPKNLLVTGSAGFIGANFVAHMQRRYPQLQVTSLDSLTYAGSKHNLEELPSPGRHKLIEGNICDRTLVDTILKEHKIDCVVNFAAESHVDRSILAPGTFVETNIRGTFELLDATRIYWQSCSPSSLEKYRFIQISTDEIYGSLKSTDLPFSEQTQYAPNSPYSASKASANLLVRAYHKTYQLPVITTNCSNNYGPYQYPEKLIPLCILNALQNKPLPIYGDGGNIRDWLYVEDHCAAIEVILTWGALGETYNIGGNNELTNLEVVQNICKILDQMHPRSLGSYAQLITFVADRPGHDWRYAIDASKITTELGWEPQENFKTGLAKTIRWYLKHQAWITQVATGSFDQWVDLNYKSR